MLTSKLSLPAFKQSEPELFEFKTYMSWPFSCNLQFKFLLTSSFENDSSQVQRQYILKTAFRASFGNDDGPQIAIMAEYDALPEIGHACGHNLIAESSVGAALGIKAALESMEKPRGRVSQYSLCHVFKP